MRVFLIDADTETVNNALIKSARKLPQKLYKSLSWDQGHEMPKRTDVARLRREARNPGNDSRSIRARAPWPIST